MDKSINDHVNGIVLVAKNKYLIDHNELLSTLPEIHLLGVLTGFQGGYKRAVMDFISAITEDEFRDSLITYLEHKGETELAADIKANGIKAN